MPKFYGYGRVSTDKQAMSPETQRDLIQRDYKHRREIGNLAADVEWGGFVADTDVSRAVKFLHRPMGADIAMKIKAGDYLCVAAYDRFLGSMIDGHETLIWLKQQQINLIIIGMNVDTSTPLGKFFFDMMGAVKELDRAEVGRRTREGLAYRKSQGLPSGRPPLGWTIKTIIPVGGRPMKYYFPCPAERRYGQCIVALKDDHGMSYREIALKLYNAKIPSPRTGRIICDYPKVSAYYHAVKNGWPLHGDIQWKSPDFKYKLAKNDVINLNRASA